MKKILTYILLITVSTVVYAQSNPLPSPLGGSAPLETRGLEGSWTGVRLYTLQQLKDSALQNNIAIRNARLNIDAASRQRKEAFTKYFPNISATGLWFNANKGTAETTLNPSEMISPDMGASLAQMFPAEALAALATPVDISMMKNGTIAGIMATQPVFAGGQIVNGNRLAKVGEEVNRLQLQLSENEVEKTVEQYYWQLVSLNEKMKTVEAVEAMLADIYKDVDVAVRAGVALLNDLLQVQLRQNEVESQKLKLQNGMEIVKLLLAQYCSLTPSPTGEGSNYLYSFDIAMPDTSQQEYSFPSAVGVSAPRETRGLEGSWSGVRPEDSVLRLLPEFGLLSKQVEATKLQHKMEIGKNLPTVAVGAGYNYHTLLDRDHTFAMMFATVSVPISDWWGGSHAVKRKRIAVQQAQEQLDNTAQLLTIRMQKAWNDVVEARQQLDIARRSIEQAGENLRLHRDYYRAGTAKMSDLLEAQLFYQQACDKHTDAVAYYQNKLLEYKQSVGQ